MPTKHLRKGSQGIPIGLAEEVLLMGQASEGKYIGFIVQAGFIGTEQQKLFNSNII